MTISREKHKFDNLNWVVSVISESEPFIGLDGNPTMEFNFCSIPENPFYFKLSPLQNFIDQDLKIDSIQNKFSGGPHKSALAPIPTTSFSISNLELFYHKLSEINGNDLNVFEGAKLEIWMVNGLNPLVVWNNSTNLWDKFNNEVSPIQDQRPTILTPNYPTNEKGFLVFTGTIEDIQFSSESTSFDCLGVSDRLNVPLGNLVDPLAQKKDRGGIFPMTFGDWSSAEDLIPVILDRDQNQVPKILLGEYPHKKTDSIRLYDKVSERDFKVTNKFVIDQNQNLVTFTADQPTSLLGANIPEDKTIYNEVDQIKDLRNDLFPDVNDGTSPAPASQQALFDIDQEPIAFHSPSNETIEVLGTSFGDLKGQRSASRSWGDQPSFSHVPTSELYEVDQDYQKAIALIDFNPKTLGFFWGGKNILTPLLAGGVGANSGNYWNVIKRNSINETDQAPDIDSFSLSEKSLNGAIPEDFFAFEFERIGFEGEILKTTIDFSAWLYSGTEQVGTNGADFNLAISVKDPTGSTNNNDQNQIIINTDSSAQTASFSYRIKGESGTTITPDSRISFFEKITPSFGWMKVKVSADLSTPDLSTIEELNSGRLGVNTIISGGSVKGSRLFYDYMSWNFQARVNAESGLWFARGVGRLNPFFQAITTAPEAIQDIMKKELKFNPFNFGTITTKRNNFPCAFSIYGNQKKWRDQLKNICFSFGMASFQSFDGKENLIDYDRRTPDFTISPEMILLNGGLQSINYSFTDREDLFNEFLIKFKKNPANNDTQSILLLNEHEIKNTDQLKYLTAQQQQQLREKVGRATKRLGFTNNEKKQFILESEFFRDSETAERMIELFILWNV